MSDKNCLQFKNQYENLKDLFELFECELEKARKVEDFKNVLKLKEKIKKKILGFSSILYQLPEDNYQCDIMGGVAIKEKRHFKKDEIIKQFFKLARINSINISELRVTYEAINEEGSILYLVASCNAKNEKNISRFIFNISAEYTSPSTGDKHGQNISTISIEQVYKRSSDPDDNRKTTKVRIELIFKKRRMG